MNKTLTALIVFLAIRLTAFGICRLAYADEDPDENEVIVTQYEWGNVQYHISLVDLKSAVKKLP